VVLDNAVPKMDAHYHLMVCASERFPLSEVVGLISLGRTMSSHSAHRSYFRPSGRSCLASLPALATTSAISVSLAGRGWAHSPSRKGGRHLVAGKGFLFSDRGDAALRGFRDPVRLFEVRWRDGEQ
jgi:hypothetical protein